MKTSESIAVLVEAMNIAKASFGPVVKDKVAKVRTKSGVDYSYAYANLSSILDAVDKPLRDNGLTLIQAVGKFEGNCACVETFLHHKSGEWLSEVASIPVVALDPQAAGSAITYCRRYGIVAILGLSPEEDDDAARAKRSKKATSVGGQMWDDLDKLTQEQLTNHAMEIIYRLARGKVAEAVDYFNATGLDEIQSAALWSRLDSKQRKAMKDHEKAKK